MKAEKAKEVTMETYIIIAAAAVAIGIIIAVLRSPGFLKKFAGSAAVGFAALGLINLTSSLTGVAIAVSWCNLLAAGILGLPGVISLVVIKTVFQL
jgi:inhibitor of the pro-sigma K processing machinery